MRPQPVNEAIETIQQLHEENGRLQAEVTRLREELARARLVLGYDVIGPVRAPGATERASGPRWGAGGHHDGDGCLPGDPGANQSSGTM